MSSKFTVLGNLGKCEKSHLCTCLTEVTLMLHKKKDKDPTVSSETSFICQFGKKKKRAHFSSLLKLLQCNCFVLCFVLLSSTTALQEVVVEASGNVVYKKVASAMPILAGESLSCHLSLVATERIM